MSMRVIILFLVLLEAVLASLYFLIDYKEKSENVDAKSCITDSDCIPIVCCHPTECANRIKLDRIVCTELCSQSCQGPIDCGAGRCGCVNKKCTVIPLKKFSK